MGLISRTLVLGAAFAAGSWVGMRPALPFFGSAPSHEATKEIPHDQNPTIDPSAMPDPLPWPRLDPDCTVHRAWLVAEGPAPVDGKRFVTFTFDDGPTTDVTPKVLKVLKKNNIHGTFFFVGQSFRGKPEHMPAVRAVARDVLSDGHMVGSHTRTHPLLPQIEHTRELAEIDEGIDIVGEVMGKRPVLFRPPYGQLDAYGEQALRARGLELVLWSVAADDKREEQAMFESLRDQIQYAGGGIVLFHDTRPETPGALEKLVAWLRLRKFDPSNPKKIGFEIVDLVTYFRETAAHPQPYPDRAALERARGDAWHAAHPKASAPKSAVGE